MSSSLALLSASPQRPSNVLASVCTVLDDDTVQSLSSWLPSADQGSAQVCKLLSDFDVFHTARTLCSHFTCTINNNNSIHNIALQFPDSLLPYAPFISQALSSLLNSNTDDVEFFMYVLGDTSYSECCIDEVAAAHLDTHVIVHYGSACMSETRNTPVLYVCSGGIDVVGIEMENVKQAIREVCAKKEANNIEKIVLLYDVELYRYFNRNEFVTIQNDGGEETNITTTYKSMIDNCNEENSIIVCAAPLILNNPDEVQIPTQQHKQQVYTSKKKSKHVRRLGHLLYDAEEEHNVKVIPLSRTAFLWFSSNSTSSSLTPAIKNALLHLCSGSDPCAAFFLHSSSTTTIEQLSLDRFLRRRFIHMSKIENAERIGIVTGTLGMAGDVESIRYCVRLIEANEKRAYIINVGKMKSVKLGNFAEIDVFVLISCPLHAFLEDDENDVGMEYMKAVVTPFELKCALQKNGDIFTEMYSTDVNQLEDEIDYGIDESQKGILIERNAKNWQVVNNVRGKGSAAEYLNQQRSWTGMSYGKDGVGDCSSDEEEGEVEDLRVRSGVHGIATKYTRELPPSG